MPATLSRGAPETPEALHPIPVASTVAVLGFAHSGCPFYEGQATIIRRTHLPHRYFVVFDGESQTRVRFVHPEYQADPEAYLRWLTEFWLASREPDITDFFPDQTMQQGG